MNEIQILYMYEEENVFLKGNVKLEKSVGTHTCAPNKL